MTDEASHELLLLYGCADATLEVTFMEHDCGLCLVIGDCGITSNYLSGQCSCVYVQVLSSRQRIVIVRETLAFPRRSTRQLHLNSLAARMRQLHPIHSSLLGSTPPWTNQKQSGEPSPTPPPSGQYPPQHNAPHGSAQIACASK